MRSGSSAPLPHSVPPKTDDAKKSTVDGTQLPGRVADARQEVLGAEEVEAFHLPGV